MYERRHLPLAEISMTDPDRALDFMYVANVFLKNILALKLTRTNATLEGLDVTNTVNRRQVFLHIAFIHELPAANLTLVSGVRMLRSTAALSMCRVVVSADRRLVAERHVADLTLDGTRSQNLQA